MNNLGSTLESRFTINDLVFTPTQTCKLEIRRFTYICRCLSYDAEATLIYISLCVVLTTVTKFCLA